MMLDSAGFSIPVRRDLAPVEDQPPTTGADDPATTAADDRTTSADDLARRRDLYLVEQARSGHAEAFDSLVELHQDHLFGLVARLVPDRDQAADVVQECFFSAYRNLTAFRGGSVRSWLSRIAVNAAMDTQRLRKRRPAQPYPELEDETWQPPAPETAEPERTAVRSERNRLLGSALATISADQRIAIVLYDIEGYDYQEIADLTGVSLGTVKSRIHRGRLALRGLLEHRMDLFRD
jgi:RNA polymerase sigma-70 factor (ECF subfamily)